MTGVTQGPWEFDATDGYIFFRPDPLTRYVVAELQSGDDRYGHLIVAAVNEKLDREITDRNLKGAGA